MPDEITDASKKQWNKLKEMRAKNNPAAPADNKPRDEQGRFTKPDESAAIAEVEAAQKAENAETAAAAQAEAEKEVAERAKSATPDTVEIEIDGKKVAIIPELAEAFNQAQAVLNETGKTADRDALKAEILAEIKAETPPKSAAEIEAERIIAEATKAKPKLKMPDSKLLIENPDEFNRQLELYIEQSTLAAKEDGKRETLAEVTKTQAETRKENDIRAKAFLREQFYSTYPVLRKSEKLVDTVIAEKFDALAKSGKVDKPLSAQAAIALRYATFADIAATSTKQLIELMGESKKVAPPAAPPHLASSAPVKPTKPTVQEPEKTKKPKYPAGSWSAVLDARRKERGLAVA